MSRQVRANVNVNISVLAHSVWGEDTKISQVLKQAEEEVLATLDKLFVDNRRIKLNAVHKVVVMYIEPAEATDET